MKYIKNILKNAETAKSDTIKTVFVNKIDLFSKTEGFVKKIGTVK